MPTLFFTLYEKVFVFIGCVDRSDGTGQHKNLIFFYIIQTVGQNLDSDYRSTCDNEFYSKQASFLFICNVEWFRTNRVLNLIDSFVKKNKEPNAGCFFMKKWRK